MIVVMSAERLPDTSLSTVSVLRTRIPRARSLCSGASGLGKTSVARLCGCGRGGRVGLLGGGMGGSRGY